MQPRIKRTMFNTLLQLPALPNTFGAHFGARPLPRGVMSGSSPPALRPQPPVPQGATGVRNSNVGGPMLLESLEGSDT